jgi:hypothetical protein
MKYVRIILCCLFITMIGSLSGKSQTKVLFLGNSQLGVYDGITGKQIYDLPGMLKDMSESAPADFPRIEIGLKLVGGASLKKLWEMGEGPGTPRAMIATGKWDYVVIQEICSIDKKGFETYATMFVEAIRKAGAKTILLATAGVTKYYSSSYLPYPDEFKTLNGMQVSFGKERGIPVAAAGYAWMKYLGRNPSEEQILDLYAKDKGHPGYKGSYIYACMLYAVITGKNPAGLTSEFKNDLSIKGSIIIRKEEAAKMQKAAWDQYRKNRK